MPMTSAPTSDQINTAPHLRSSRALPRGVQRPGTPAYDSAVRPWNLAVAPRPVGVVEAGSAADIVQAVRLAGQLGTTVAVQSTGHGASSSMTGSLMVSTRAMTSLEIDPVRRLAVAGAGVRWSQVLEAGAPLGLAGLAGSAPHVGVAGYTTGGGVGPIARSHGLASDRVRSFEVVTGDGELRRADPTENPDLFWALRGGRGLTGIVTSIEFELLPLASLYGGAVYFDGAEAAQVLHRWADWSATLPPEATTSVALLRLPATPAVPPPLAGRLTVAVRFAWTSPAARGADVLAPMRAAAAPLLDTVSEMPYAAIGSIHADPVDPMPMYDSHALLGDLDADAVDALLAVAGPGTDAPQIIVELRQLGGAITRAEENLSAFSARHARHSLMTIGLAVPPVLDAVVSHAHEVGAALRPWQVSGGLPTFAAREGADWLKRTYDRDTLRRLSEVSRSYDPGSKILGAGELHA